MAWVKAEYAGELAVLATWLTALLPWSVSFLRRSPRGMDATFTVVNIRFVFWQFHYVFGISLGEQTLDDLVQFTYELPAITDPVLGTLCTVLGLGCRSRYLPANQQTEALIWAYGALRFLGLLAVSVVYYARERSLFATATAVAAERPVLAAVAAVAVLAVALLVWRWSRRRG
jgi:hypothetical protein